MFIILPLSSRNPRSYLSPLDSGHLQRLRSERNPFEKSSIENLLACFRLWADCCGKLLTKGFSPKATRTKAGTNSAMWTKAGTNFSPQAIGTKACTRLSGLGAVPISLRASGLSSAFPVMLRS